MYKRPILDDILSRLQEPRKFIQVLLGPRQVGKTTLANQVIEKLNKPHHFISADLATLQDLSWLQKQWEIARSKILNRETGGILVIDEVQKIPHWSEVIKSLWDEDSRNKVNMDVMLLGSSPWLMQKGLSESLTGRFELIPITHWSYIEMHQAFTWDIDQYKYFGGYPGAATLADKASPERWNNYINDAIIETTISRDILLMTNVNKPVLLRRLFQLGCIYSSQIVSLTKMLGQLQDAGNVTTLAHYLALLEGAGLLTGLQKFANQAVRKRSSTPKFMVYNTALMSAQSGKNYTEIMQDQELNGKFVESMVGTYLVNNIRGTQIKIYYWREGDKEVDFVLQRGERITAIEVKSNNDTFNRSGMDLFVKKFSPTKVLLVGDQGIPVLDFISKPITEWL